MPCILLVDDDHLVGSLLEDVLRVYGYEVSRAPDTAIAWELFCSDKPDAVVTDNRFKWSRPPEETGLAFARRVKAASPHTPVVMASSDPPPEARMTCDVVFAKPIPMSVLRDALCRLGVPPGDVRSREGHGENPPGSEELAARN